MKHVGYLYIIERKKVKVKSLSCVRLCNPMDCSLPGSSLFGILQTRVLEWVVISFSRGSSKFRDQTWVSLIPGRRFNFWATREAPHVEIFSFIQKQNVFFVNLSKNYYFTTFSDSIKTHFPIFDWGIGIATWSYGNYLNSTVIE